MISCKNGHALTPDNVVFASIGEGRYVRRCRTCRNLQRAVYACRNQAEGCAAMVTQKQQQSAVAKVVPSLQ